MVSCGLHDENSKDSVWKSPICNDPNILQLAQLTNTEKIYVICNIILYSYLHNLIILYDYPMIQDKKS